jgi:hypothetical protein
VEGAIRRTLHIGSIPKLSTWASMKAVTSETGGRVPPNPYQELAK